MSSTRYSSTTPADSAPLFQPLTFPSSGRTAPNRFLNASMSEGLGTWHPTDIAARGIPTPETITLYRNWGAGGWGQIQTGNIMIDGAHLEARGNMAIPSDAPFSGPRFDAFTALAAAAKAHGSLIVGQVSHPGRQSAEPSPISASGIRTVAPSMHRVFEEPRVATKADLEAVVAGFAHAAAYLERAGFDGIELHSAHGYLLAEFFSRATNKRTDEYGGSLENRMRLLLEIVAAVQARVSESFVVGAKINTVEFNELGVTPAESAALCEALDRAGLDFVELSGGNYEKWAFTHADDASRAREAFFVHYAEDMVPRLRNIKVYATGGFQTVGRMVAALDVVHGVGLAKAACQEPRFPRDLQASATGAISGVVRTAIPDDNFLYKLLGAGCQIRQIGKDEEPVDLSDPENVDKVWADIAGHFQKVSQDEKRVVFGCPDLSVPSMPYRV